MLMVWRLGWDLSINSSGWGGYPDFDSMYGTYTMQLSSPSLQQLYLH